MEWAPKVVDATAAADAWRGEKRRLSVLWAAAAVADCPSPINAHFIVSISLERDCCRESLTQGSDDVALALPSFSFSALLMVARGVTAVDEMKSMSFSGNTFDIGELIRCGMRETLFC